MTQTDEIGKRRGTSLEKTPRRAAAAAFLGTAAEYYDFFIYGTAAALVFNKVFFPDFSAAAGTLLSLSTFGVAYVVRPLAAIGIGHLGDRMGRKRLLVLTLGLMGVSTFCIGILPSYSSIGVAAPLLLVLCRILQGVSAAGEQSGGASMALEHAPDDRRGFFASWTLCGANAGQVLAVMAFLSVSALPDDDLFTWGWRIPFLLSAVVFAIALLVRGALPETPEFERNRLNGDLDARPVVSLMRNQWRDVLRVACCALMATTSSVTTVFGLSYATQSGVDRDVMLWSVVAAYSVSIITQPLFARLSDKIGRKPVFIGGVLSCAVLVYVYFAVIVTGSVVAIVLVSVLMTGIAYASANGIWPSFYPEQFQSRYRYSGMAIGTQFGFVMVGATPIIGAALTNEGDRGWLPVAIYTSVCCLISATAATFARETYNVPTSELGTLARTRHPLPAGTL